jgi:hypothetical protein
MTGFLDNYRASANDPLAIGEMPQWMESFDTSLTGADLGKSINATAFGSANTTGLNTQQNFLGKANDFVNTNLGGWGNALGGLNALFSMYTGWKSMGLAEDQLDFQKNMFNKNYAAQRQDYENQLRDRWAARNASAELNGRSFQSEQAFLNQRNIPA